MPGADAYPMAAVTYAVVPRDRGAERIGRVLDLFRLAYETGAKDASALGYIPVPAPLSRQVEQYWSTALQNPSN